MTVACPSVYSAMSSLLLDICVIQVYKEGLKDFNNTQSSSHNPKWDVLLLTSSYCTISRLIIDRLLSLLDAMWDCTLPELKMDRG